jgi:hypothetical protein
MPNKDESGNLPNQGYYTANKARLLVIISTADPDMCTVHTTYQVLQDPIG